MKEPTETDLKGAEKIFDSLGYQYGTEERQSAIAFIALGLVNATPDEPWHIDRHGAIECRECGADAGYGAGTPSARREAFDRFEHNAECSHEPRKA